MKQVGRELGVRYVLEGSVRKAANRVRITGQLVDANTGATLWSERFESAIDDVFELQDQMATSVVGALAPHLERAEIERARHKPTESLDAYDYYMRGMWKFRQVSRSAIDEALPLFYEAIRRDPEFASAYAMAAWCHSWRKLSRWVTDLEREIAEGTRLARRAVELGQNDAVALAASAHALTHLVRDFDSSIALLDRALVLDPNLAAGWYLGGFVRIWRGEPDDAIERIARGMRLSPLGPDMHRMEVGTAMAHLLAGRTEDALSWAEKASRHKVGSGAVRSASSPPFMLAPDVAMRPGWRCSSFASSIRNCGSPILVNGSRSSVPKTSPCSRTVCAKQDCRSNGKSLADHIGCKNGG